ncbi:stage V sporulation protein E [Clostridium manihotivorum]|uniref:Probable peptidoglycan glycosyltransferase FtsW n=1 Tax=Clostridium manihotivorum TaxID=2320868 RepID=A0A410DSQ6_9CLOT|nr:stage V sporulation protein E [Clostridium manihotivorum]QAA32032.1 stage V sporulation protein E [Clostridium manihotivorum]
MKKKKPKMGQIDYVTFYTIFFLLAIGVVMVYSASSYYAMYKNNDSMFFLKKQLQWSVLGIAVMLFMMSVDYHKMKKYTRIMMIISLPLLVAVLFSKDVNGAKRWIQLGPLGQFQPSELVKYVVVLFMATSMEKKGEKMKSFKEGVLPYLIVSGFYAGMILLEKNLSIASVIMIVTLIVMFVAGAKSTTLGFGVVPAMFAAATFFIFSEDYRRRRLLNFLNPWQDPAGDGYQLIQSFYALGAGGVTGLGIGQSRQKTLYMPEPHNDFIFAIIGEELGLIGCALIIILFIIFVFRGIRIAMGAKDAFGTLLATGITSIVAVQAIINIAVVTGSMPVTGVPLPFISYGGSSLVINMAAMGVLLNISRQVERKRVI